MKNLVVVCAGNSSLHHNYKKGNYDLLINYYGNKNKYKEDAKYYFNFKGTKLKIAHQLYEHHKDIIEKYDNIFLPDDDIYYKSEDLNKFFDLFKEYELKIAQTSILGWYSHYFNLKVDNVILTYTNYVEFINVCFSIDSFIKCLDTFVLTKSGWGIENIWFKLIGNPIDKMAVVHDVYGIHTRPVMSGDNYILNNLKESECFDDAKLSAIAAGKNTLTQYKNILKKDKKATYPELIKNTSRKDKICPNNNEFLKYLLSLRKNKKIYI